MSANERPASVDAGHRQQAVRHVGHARIDRLRAVRSRVAIACCAALLFVWCGPLSFLSAETEAIDGSSAQAADLEAYRQLLQKGLDLHEIDRELARLAEEEARVAERIASVEEALQAQAEASAIKKKEAGRVLRSYYMGHRETLYLSLLKMDSLVDALTALDFLQMLFRHDRNILDGYRDSMRSLKAAQTELVDTQAELAALQTAFLKQREEQTRLAEELEQELAALPASAEIRSEIELLTLIWETEGLPLFRTYFSSLADTMQQLPEMIANDAKHLTIRGSRFDFQLSDDDLNAFLRSKDALFERLTFRFADGMITAEGSDGGHHIELSGKYVLENEPENSIRFRVESVSFNRFRLPESTVKELEEQFDLSIYPAKFELDIEATGVKLEDDVLQIQLKAKANWLDAIFGGWLF